MKRQLLQNATSKRGLSEIKGKRLLAIYEGISIPEVDLLPDNYDPDKAFMVFWEGLLKKYGTEFAGPIWDSIAEGQYTDCDEEFAVYMTMKDLCNDFSGSMWGSVMYG